MTEIFRSLDPASGAVVWEGPLSSPDECRLAVAKARSASGGWARTHIDERVSVVRRFGALLRDRAELLAELISRETGKLLWDSRSEVAAMIGKIEISIAAQRERAGTREQDMPFGRAVLRHRPHGVMAVLGPYNFPGHLPNGHIVPALLAGNCLVFKPSEETPATGEAIGRAWADAGLPAGVVNVVQGGRETGAALVDQEVDGLLFTGSARAGRAFRHAFLDRPHAILALELGGNNPLVVWDGDPQAAASIAVHSAFITSGQRCSCARRLVLPEGRRGDDLLEAIAEAAASLKVAAWDDGEEAFMGPLVSGRAAARARDAVQGLVERGARTLVATGVPNGRNDAFATAGMVDVTGMRVPDEEIFAPFLQVTRVPDFGAAIRAANDTSFGLAAGLVSEDPDLWIDFASEVRAGVVNWNRPTTGASSSMPFGGLGESGNHRPSAFYASDYCAFPTASFEAGRLAAVPVPGSDR